MTDILAAHNFLALLVLLFAFDALTTFGIIKRGAWMMDRIGAQAALFAVKVGVFGIIASVTPQLAHTWRLAILAAYVLLVLWNLSVIARMKRRNS